MDSFWPIVQGESTSKEAVPVGSERLGRRGRPGNVDNRGGVPAGRRLKRKTTYDENRRQLFLGSLARNFDNDLCVEARHPATAMSHAIFGSGPERLACRMSSGWTDHGETYEDLDC
jgi:hypothetical protein